MSITTELERINDEHPADIADGAGVYAGTNPPRRLNIAMAISGGLTTNIAHACDMFYGNDPVSMTISQAIAKGVEAGSPYASIADILKAIDEGSPDDTLPKIIVINSKAGTSFLEGSSFTNAADAYQFAMAHIVDGSVPASALVLEDTATVEPFPVMNASVHSYEGEETYIYWVDDSTGDTIALYSDRIELP